MQFWEKFKNGWEILMDKNELKSSFELFAHKIKNPIHAAAINLDVLQVKLSKQGADKKTLKHVEIAAAEVQRISVIVQKYFDYLKLSDSERKKKNNGEKSK